MKSLQCKHYLRPSRNVSCSCTFCRPTEYPSHGTAGHRPEGWWNYHPGNSPPHGCGGSLGMTLLVWIRVSRVHWENRRGGRRFLNAIIRLLGGLKGGVSGSSCEVTIIATAVIALALLIAFIPGHLLGFQQFLEFTLDYGFV